MAVKVLQLGKGMTPPSIGGIEKVITDIAVGLSPARVHCDVLCVNASGIRETGRIGSGEFVRVPQWTRLLSQVIAPRLFLELWKRRNDYDIVHIHCPDPLASLALFLTRPKGRLVVHWHSDIVRQRLLRRVYLPLQRWMLRRADRIVATSPPYAASSLDLADFREKISIVPIGMNPGELVVDPAKTASIRSEYAGRCIVFTLGRLAYYKDYRSLIRASRELPESCMILIGGGGELRIELQAEIDALVLNGRVRLLGTLPDNELGAYYEACDLFVLSSDSRAEAFGIVQLHAMSFGKPVISTDIPGSGVGWVNKDGVSGRVVPVSNPMALAKAITSLMQDDSERRRLGEGARMRFQENFTMKKMTDALETLYDGLVPGRGS